MPDQPGLKHTGAFQRSLVQQHPAVAGKVAGIGEEAGMTGNPAHRRRQGIMDLTAQESPVISFFGGSDIVSVAGGRTESCIGHPQRRKDPGVSEPVQGFSADDLYQPAQKNESKIAVDEAGSRCGRQVGSMDLVNDR